MTRQFTHDSITKDKILAACLFVCGFSFPLKAQTSCRQTPSQHNVRLTYPGATSERASSNIAICCFHETRDGGIWPGSNGISGHNGRQTDEKQESQVSEPAIVTNPFFFKTHWFMLFIALTPAAWLFFRYQQKVSAYEKRQLILLGKVKERTMELEKKMEQLSIQNRLLTQQKKQLSELLSKRIQEKTGEVTQQQFSIQISPAIVNMEESSRDNRFLKKVMVTIETHYKNPSFDVNAFATTMGMSKSLLNQKLQRLAGMSTARFIRDFRLNKAHGLILENKVSKNMNISEIAYEVGFNDPKYFSRCYQKRTGLSPNT